MLTVGSVFAGMGGFDCAFREAGFRIAWQVEICPDARRVLRHHHPDAVLKADVRTEGKHTLPPVDVITGGFPCQNLSVAGKRAGLSGEQSALFWELLRVTDELRPKVLVWENVFGLLTSFTPTELPPEGAVEGDEWEVEEDSDFETVLCALAGIGYYGAWRVLDSQFFSLAQRRERVFGVFAPGRAGADRAAKILALAEGRRRHPPPRGPEKADVAGTLGSGPQGSGWRNDLDRAGAFVTGTLTGNGDAHSGFRLGDGLAVTEPEVATSVQPGQRRASGNTQLGHLVCGTLNAHSKAHGHATGTQQAAESGQLAVATAFGGGNAGAVDVATTLSACKTASGRQDFETETFIVHAAESCAKERHAFPSDVARSLDSTGGFAANQGGTIVVTGGSSPTVGNDVCPTLRAGHGFGKRDKEINGAPAVLYYTHDYNQNRVYDSAGETPALCSQDSNRTRNFSVGASVRRLTPRECARLQGFRDDYLDLDPPLSDSAKYRLLGNAVSVPVAEWIARRTRKVLEASP